LRRSEVSRSPLLDIWELCTAYYVPNNEFSRKALVSTREVLGMPAGLLHREERPEYARALRDAAGAPSGKAPLRPSPLPALFTSSLERPFRMVLAGSGGRQSALHRPDDRRGGGALRPVGGSTGRLPRNSADGHSISELIFSPREILFTGISQPDALVLISAEGRKMAGRYLQGLTKESWLFTDAGVRGP